MSRGKKIAIGAIAGLILLCGAGMLFVNWANSDEGQAAMDEVGTKQAVSSATARVEETARAESEARAAGTATAVMLDIDRRIQNAQLVFEDGLDEGSPFIAENIMDYDLTYKDGVAAVSLPWNGFFVIESGKQLTDFIAEVDCDPQGDGISCGIAYGVRKKEDRFYYYASLTAGSYKCGFFDYTVDFPKSSYSICNYPTEGLLQHLRVEKFGSNLRFYVGGKLMDQRILENQDFLTGGVALIFGRAGGEQSEINKVWLDNFKVWEIP